MKTVGPEDRSGSWLLVTVSTAAAPASLRVYVWRRLRLLGAVYLQQSVCVLPALPAVGKEINRFADRVRRNGGTVRILGFQVTDKAEHQRLVAEFNDARNLEYSEVLERVPSFLEELDMGRERGRSTYAEVEESEADLERFRSWLAKIAKRDYFHAAKGPEAEEAVDKYAQQLTAFEAEAFAAEGSELVAAARLDDVVDALGGDPLPTGRGSVLRTSRP
jgi:hypothetical protein